MPVRRRRPVARVATTAVVAGAAARAGAKAAQSNTQTPAELEGDPADMAAEATPDSPQVDELKQLAALKDQGILTEDEFTAKKAQILGL